MIMRSEEKNRRRTELKIDLKNGREERMSRRGLEGKKEKRRIV